MLQFTPDCTALRLNADWLSSRKTRVKVEIFQLERICRTTNPRERARLCTVKVCRDKSKHVAVFSCEIRDTRLYVHFVWDLVTPSRLV